MAPSTHQPEKRRIVGFRWAVDRKLRDAFVEWAGDFRLSNPWAARGCDHPHAVRILTRAWVYVIWRCWQDSSAYDPTKHAGSNGCPDPRAPSRHHLGQPDGRPTRQSPAGG
jgi:hypothetical protein